MRTRTLERLGPDLLWPPRRVCEAAAVLAHASGLAPEAEPSSADVSPASGVAGVEATAARLDLETEVRTADYVAVEEVLTTLGPALIEIEARDAEPAGFLVVFRRRRRSYVLAPDHRVHACSVEALRAFLCAPAEEEIRGSLEEILELAAIPERRREDSLRAWFRRSLGDRKIFRARELVPAVGSPAAGQILQAGLGRPPVVLAGAHILEQVFLIAAWWLLGLSVLSGRFDSGQVWAWALLFLGIIPIRAFGAWAQGVFTLGAGALLKRRLMAGALRMAPERIRGEGAGRHLGKVIESETVETLALNGGFATLLCGIELVTAAFVLAMGVAPGLHLPLLLLWTAAAVIVTGRYFGAYRIMTRVRVAMTHRLVEHLIGRRTRLVQEDPENFHDEEDLALRAHLDRSRNLDRWIPRLGVLMPRGWLFLALATLGPSLIDPELSVEKLAVSLGGIFLALRGLESLAAGLGALTGTAVASEQIRDLYQAARHAPEPGSVALLQEAWRHGSAPLKLDAEGVSFAYPARGRAVLEEVDLVLRSGDLVLLEGASGGGKSTLVSLLAGLREPSEGRISIHGADPRTWGREGWARWVVCAPQFHENHLFVGPLAFNVLLGRDWPPSLRDLEEAEEICRGVGLGELLDRMPGGMMQAVGESGWRLSHGERSRVYLARALLQGAELVVLDESFAALDPGNFLTALECARSRVPSLLVVAHRP